MNWFCRLFHQPWHFWNVCLLCQRPSCGVAK